MSILGGGTTDFPSILGSDDLDIDCINLTVQNQFTINSLGLTNTQWATLQGINTDQTIQDQINDIINVTSGEGYWGSFWSTIDQVASTSNTAYLVTFNSFDASNNSIVLTNQIGSTGNYEGIRVNNGAVYNIQISLQLTSTSSSTSDFKVWYKKNGTNISASSATASTHNNNNFVILTYNLVIKLADNDIISFGWQTSNTNLSLDTIPATTTPYVSPASPSVIATFTQVQYYQDNTAVVVGLEADVAQLQTDMSQAQTDIANNTTNIASNTSSINTLNTQMTTANANIATNTSNITSNTNSINTLNSQMSTANSNITTLQNDMTSVQAGLATVGTATATNTAGIAGLVASQSAQDVIITSHTASIGTLNTSVGSLTTKTQNISAVPNVTTISGTLTGTGSVDFANASIDNLALNVSMTGVGKFNLSSTTGAHTVYSPSFRVGSASGTGGSVYLGGYGDSVYINNFPSWWYSSNQF
jgi:hypothetical protein